MRFVFRNFPLAQMHLHAAQAAKVAESAKAQGKFWKTHDLLYENQKNLAGKDLLEYGKNPGLDGNQFACDLKNETHDNKIQAGFTSGVEGSVNSTPTFFINGIRFDGDWRNEESLIALKSKQSI